MLRNSHARGSALGLLFWGGGYCLDVQAITLNIRTIDGAIGVIVLSRSINHNAVANSIAIVAIISAIRIISVTASGCSSSSIGSICISMRGVIHVGSVSASIGRIMNRIRVLVIVDDVVIHIIIIIIAVVVAMLLFWLLAVVAAPVLLAAVLPLSRLIVLWLCLALLSLLLLSMRSPLSSSVSS